MVITGVLNATTTLPFSYPDLNIFTDVQAVGTPITWRSDLVIICEDVHNEVMIYLYIIYILLFEIINLFLINYYLYV